MALRTRGNAIARRTGINTPNILRTSRLLATITGFDVQPNKAIVGRNAFAHKGGLHIAGMRADARTFEHVDPLAVGNAREIVVSELMTNAIRHARPLAGDGLKARAARQARPGPAPSRRDRAARHRSIRSRPVASRSAPGSRRGRRARER